MPESLTTATLPSPGSATHPERWLIVDQQTTDPAELTKLLNEIQRVAGLDPYTARQRLQGRGYALLLRGEEEKLSPLLSLLSEYSIPSRLLTPLLPTKHPAKLQSLRRSGAVLILVADNSEITIDRDVQVVAVFADLSGTVVANGMKQLLVRNAYQGSTGQTTHNDERFCREISKARPVLDLYLLNTEGKLQGAVRALPGRFDPDGLGEAKTMSAGLNLLALIELARSCAGGLTLRSDFGLANLPGCQLDTPLTEANAGKNLAALSRFGLFAVQFIAQAPPVGSPSAPRPPLAARPTQTNNEPPRQGPSLPPPPEGEGESPRSWLWPWEDTLGVVLTFAFFAVSMTDVARILPWLWRGMSSGVLPALLAIILFWRGFAAVRLKRMIENTPVSRIRSLATGMVEVKGRAERCYALVTPVTQVPCIYYRLRRFRRGERNNDWQMIAERSSGLHPFWLQDATGKVLVDPAGADLRPATREEGSGAGLNNGFFVHESSPDGDEKWVEESIPEGENLYVLGFSMPRRVVGDSLHEATAARLRELKGSRDLHQRFDKDGDGVINADEWDEARRVTSEEVARAQLAGKQDRRKQEESLVIGAPPHRSLPFLVAQSLSEEGVTRTLWWRGLGFFCVGFAVAGWAIRQLL